MLAHLGLDHSFELPRQAPYSQLRTRPIRRDVKDGNFKVRKDLFEVLVCEPFCGSTHLSPSGVDGFVVIHLRRLAADPSWLQ